MLAVDRHREGRASLGKAADLAGLSIGEMMGVLETYGVTADLTTDEHRVSLDALERAW